MKKLPAFFKSLLVVIVASASLAIRANNHVIYTRNLANGLCDIPVAANAILSTMTLEFFATNILGPCDLVITTKCNRLIYLL